MRSLVCACVVRKPPKTGFLASRPINLVDLFAHIFSAFHIDIIYPISSNTLPTLVYMEHQDAAGILLSNQCILMLLGQIYVCQGYVARG